MEPRCVTERETVGAEMRRAAIAKRWSLRKARAVERFEVHPGNGARLLLNELGE